MPRIAIIGAGIAGLTLARALQNRADITVFDKSRGVSGRTSTRYADPFQFDHGAPFFTAATPAFQQWLAPWLEDGLIAPWDASCVRLAAGQSPVPFTWDQPHYVATPRMNSLCKHLAEPLNIELGEAITAMKRHDTHWRLYTAEGMIEPAFDWVICTAPAAQTRTLMPAAFAHHDAVARAKQTACYSLMIGYGEALPFTWDYAEVTGSAIERIVVNSRKPGRQSEPSVLIQTSSDWAERTIDEDRAALSEALISELAGLIGLVPEKVTHHALHGWRYAHSSVLAGAPCLLDVEQSLAACGDWCVEGSVEGAFTSAMALAAAFTQEGCFA